MTTQLGPARVCLDFGTSFSKAALFAPASTIAEAARPLALGAAAGADTAWLAPSVLFVDEGRIFVGPPALARARAPGRRRADPIVSFKTIFAARDLEAALALKTPASIDPTRTLSFRDAVVIYLAHLDRLVRAALTREGLEPLAQAPRRYTTPIWRTRDDADRIIGRLFDEAIVVSAKLADALIGAEGVSIAQTKAVLADAHAQAGAGALETSVFEAHAAAAAYAAFAPQTPRFFLLLDMGAGTTDIAGFERIERDGEILMSELRPARQSCGLAGDEIDQIIVNLAAAKRSPRDAEAAHAHWRALRLGARAAKRELFAAGRAQLTTPHASITVTRDELMRSAPYKALQAALAAIIEPSVTEVSRQAGVANAEAPVILMAGGGANTPLLKDALIAAAHKAGLQNKLKIERVGEDWRLPLSADPDLKSLMPQLAIALGGALVDVRADA
ncbi:MAG: Hsp70 family protein [Hyphomonadaceae bacterium]|nr:Hsp70 family protein [Hyphomonadaceae bacterium]